MQNKINTYYPAFDWLRLLLAMMVALTHHDFITDHNMANFAVLVFFSLSGWLIGGILLDSQQQDLPRFYFNRATRIWIPYYFSVLLLFAVSLLKEPLDIQWIEYFIYDLTFTHNYFITPRIGDIFTDLPLQGTNNHFWSLSVEEQFYLFAPLILLFFRHGRSILLWSGLLAISFVSNSLYTAIILGVIAIALQRKYDNWHLELPWVLLFATLFAGCTIWYIVDHTIYHQIAPIAAICVVLLCARPGKINILGSFVGGISYPLYLNHWIGIFIANAVAGKLGLYNHTITVLLGTLLNLVIASGLYISIDQQIQKQRNRYFTVHRGQLLAFIAYGLIIIGMFAGWGFSITR